MHFALGAVQDGAQIIKPMIDSRGRGPSGTGKSFHSTEKCSRRVRSCYEIRKSGQRRWLEQLKNESFEPQL